MDCPWFDFCCGSIRSLIDPQVSQQSSNNGDMTVSYNLEVSTSCWWTWAKVMLRWRGSIWKSVFNELLLWTLCYYIVFIIYRWFLPLNFQQTFVFVAHHIEKTTLDYVHTPLRLMLAFFVAFVVDRWKKMFCNVGFVDNAAFYIGTYVRGDDNETKITRRNLVRYMCLTQILLLRDICQNVRERFPTLDSIVTAGFMQPHELEMFEKTHHVDPSCKCWVPISWSYTLVYELWEKQKIAKNRYCNTILHSIEAFCDNLHNLRNYDWVPVPLAYPQVVYLAVHSYFILCLITRQFINHEPPSTVPGLVPGNGTSSSGPETIETYNAHDLYVTHYYVPFMSMLQYIFYVGWLKVGEALLNPLGNDDDDFECNYVINENLSLGLMLVDDCYAKAPEQKPDSFGKAHVENSLMHNEDKRWYKHALHGSAAPENHELSMIPAEVVSNNVSKRRCFSDKARGSKPDI
ncbi:bestrophin, RFP-TM, chloride channel domain-containing protein [Ditylenchus destructor]|uniref:Bestrophin homolog n=1 Tax=Ditylenchus destructor TaxID=166010 RepID=A0AAD4R3G6_9BILA|nr:bestrophin, RFP-TM, chloride channel domain-containing protein [Ditylenchus destructor]